MSKDIKTRLDYESGTKLIPEGAFKIGPSSIGKFFDKPYEWYAEQVEGKKIFTGNTASVLGTCVHFVAEEFSKKQEVDREEVIKYIDKHEDDPEIDTDYIREQWKVMGQELINYISKKAMPTRSEEMISAEIMPGYYAAGSCDAVVNENTIVDYKTTSAFTAPATIPMKHKYQLMTYAWIYKQMGLKIDRMRIVWITNNVVGRVSEKTGKPLKDYPCKVTSITEPITDNDFLFIEHILKLIAESVEKSKECPELTYLIFKDFRLKEIK